MGLPSADEILKLDLLTLSDHTKQAGDTLDRETYRDEVVARLNSSEVISLRQDGALIAYATLHAQEDGCWFVSGFNTHPGHRSAPVFRQLFSQLLVLAQKRDIKAFRSHVYKTNRLSIAFHQRLGFSIARGNDKGIEFYIGIESLRAGKLMNHTIGLGMSLPTRTKCLVA
jgi:ribosomal protein S18 acetylase RimI-like enzyme